MRNILMFASPLLVLAMPAAAQTMAPTDYVKAAGAGDMYEIQSSKLVLATTRDAKVQSFADMMVKHHTKSTADVKAAAKRDRVAVAPPVLNAEQAGMIAELRAATGPARDTAYVTQQKMAHDKALALHSSYASGGTAPALKATAAKIVPVVQSHIDMLAGM